MNTTIVPTQSEMMKALEAKMIEVALILETRYQKEMPIPTIRLEKTGTTAGYAESLAGGIGRITLNIDMCNHPRYWSDILNITLPHEYCHLVAPLIYDRWKHGYDKREGWGHGRAWKECMRVLGLPPEVCHDMSDDMEFRNQISLRKVERKYIYGCNCGKLFHLTAILHNRIQSGRGRHCRDCNGSLIFKGYKA